MQYVAFEHFAASVCMSLLEHVYHSILTPLTLRECSAQPQASDRNSVQDIGMYNITHVTAAECSGRVQSAECSVQSAVRTVQCAECRVQRAACRVQSAACRVQRAVRRVQCTECSESAVRVQ